MIYHVWVDHEEWESELVKFSHDGRRKKALVPRAIALAADRGGRALTVAPEGGGPTDVRRITQKMRNAYA